MLSNVMKFLRTVGADALKVSIPLAALLGLVATFLPGLHASAAATGEFSAALGLLNAFINWAHTNGFSPVASVKAIFKGTAWNAKVGGTAWNAKLGGTAWNAKLGEGEWGAVPGGTAWNAKLGEGEWGSVTLNFHPPVVNPPVGDMPVGRKEGEWGVAVKGIAHGLDAMWTMVVNLVKQFGTAWN